MASETNLPTWAVAVPDERYSNVACKACGCIQSRAYRACVFCCTHDELTLTEGWHGDDEHGGWELDAACPACGKSHDFTRELLMREYKLVRKAAPKTGGQ